MIFLGMFFLFSCQSLLYISIKFYTDKNIFKKIANLKKNDHINF